MNFETDYGKIIDGLKVMRRSQKPGDIAKVSGAIESLKSLPLPAAYLDGVRDEILYMLGVGRVLERTSVYLSFYGNDDRASYLKIGIAKNVRSRMSGIATGNPVPRLWTWVATYHTKMDALAVETALLQHMQHDKLHGEWIRVAGLSEEAAQAVVDSLAEVATIEHGRAKEFTKEVW